jgi:multidrug efflux pump subunit AcrA (membrane-fusion protein)
VSADSVLDLADCTEFRQTVLARPPRVFHGTFVLCVSLLAAAVAWAALTEADLVVRAPGRVRPVSPPVPIRVGARGEVLSGSLGGRVVEVAFHEGQEVRAGQALLRLDTARLVTEIAKKRQAIAAHRYAAGQLRQRRERLEHEFTEAREKARAELDQAEEAEKRARERRESDLRLAHAQLEFSRQEVSDQRALLAKNATTRVDAQAAEVRLLQAREQLLKAEQPVDTGAVRIARRALALVEDQYAARRGEAALAVSAKEAEAAEVQRDLEALQLELDQATVRSPADGVVTRGEVLVGTVLEPGQVVAEVAGQRGFLFEADVPNEEVSHLRLGQPARVKLDAYDYQQYGMLPGTVWQIAEDAGGQGPATYRVRIKLDAEEVVRGSERGRLKLGLAGQAEIVTDKESLLWLLLKRIRRSISLG